MNEGNHTACILFLTRFCPGGAFGAEAPPPKKNLKNLVKPAHFVTILATQPSANALSPSQKTILDMPVKQDKYLGIQQF